MVNFDILPYLIQYILVEIFKAFPHPYSYLYVSFVSGFCPDLSHIPNGQVVHASPKVGQAALEFRCNRNFRLVGTPRLECINGRWNGMVPFCESKL